MVNLFSQIARRKPLAGDLKAVDKENMAYVKNVISDVGKRGKIVVAWGNSHSTNLVVNESKNETFGIKKDNSQACPVEFLFFIFFI